MKVHLSGPVGVHDLDINNQINIYPNPNTGNFQIKISGGYANYVYDIIDIKGTKIFDGKVNCITEECIFDINLANALPGVYTLVIKRDGVFFGQRKFIISK